MIIKINDRLKNRCFSWYRLGVHNKADELQQNRGGRREILMGNKNICVWWIHCDSVHFSEVVRTESFE
jgi:hypothetical protein